ncbi:hypothetical protein BC01_051 [Bacillus phage BC01]|nr:hypothetical protein PBC6_043 [Bacillus phage PBC6]AXU41148.1 hypothetical protein BC01_051 [Bacillus phage BC01]
MLSWFRKKKQDQTQQDMDLMSRKFTGMFCAHVVFVRMAGTTDKFLVLKDAKELFENKIVSKAIVNHMLQQELNVIVLTEVTEVVTMFGLEKQQSVIAKNWIGGVRNG